MAGSLAVARTALFRHPSFWGEDEAEQLVGQIVEDKRVTNAEQQIFLTLAAQTTPFVASLDEATVNVGHLCPSEGIETKDVFKRILEAPFNVLTGKARDVARYIVNTAALYKGDRYDPLEIYFCPDRLIPHRHTCPL